jgi:hypothetical protein
MSYTIYISSDVCFKMFYNKLLRIVSLFYHICRMNFMQLQVCIVDIENFSLTGVLYFRSYFYSLTFFSSWLDSPRRAPPHPGFEIALRHTTFSRTPLDKSLARRRDPYLTAPNIHMRHPCPAGIRTNNPRKRGAADPLLRPRGHWERLYSLTVQSKAFLQKPTAA